MISEYNIFNWKNIIIYIFLLFDSYYFDAFTKWNIVFNLLHLSGIIKFSPGFLCCLSSIISIMFYSALNSTSINEMCLKRNMNIYSGIFMDLIYHLLPFLYWNFFCLYYNVKIYLEEALFVIFLYISWIRSRSLEYNSYSLKAWDASHVYVEYKYKLPFIYGLYGSLITMYFINKKSYLMLLFPFFHILVSQINNYYDIIKN